MGEDYAYTHTPGGPVGEEESGVAGRLAAAAGAPEGEGPSASAPFEVLTPAPLTEAEEDQVMARLRGLRRGSQRAVLHKLLGGEMLRADPEAMREWEEIQRKLAPPENFRMKVGWGVGGGGGVREVVWVGMG